MLGKKMKTEMLRFWKTAREVAITTLTVHLLCKTLGLSLCIFFSAALMKDGANKKALFQPLNPLGEYSYYRHLRRNSRRRYK